ncbi:MAG: hypothetical protein LC781_05165 [Actinobacteria bacterium]|nr:hypothetical protein [Actinomycetota bacterium]
MIRTTRRQRRAVIGHIGRRAIARRARTLTARVLQLDAEGFGPAAIASSTGLAERTVRTVLEDPGEGGA